MTAATPAAAAAPASESAAVITAGKPDNATPVLPGHITAGREGTGPRFSDDVWDVRPFVPRTTPLTRADFTTITDAGHRRTIREYLYSRINHGVPASQRSGTARPMKITNLYGEFREVRQILADLAAAGAARLADVDHDHLDTVLAGWKQFPDGAAGLVGVVKHLAAHGPFLTDHLTITPWPGRGANVVAGRRPPPENATPRIPEHIIAPLLKAAVFYVQTASADLIAARTELDHLDNALTGIHLGPGQPRARLHDFIARRRLEHRGIPALPVRSAHRAPGAVIDGVVQAPNLTLIALLAGVPGGSWYHQDLLKAAGQELGYEAGGLDTAMSIWPDTARPWRARLDPSALGTELLHLRTACWILIAYLSGMRDAEVRELGRDCAFTEPGADGRTRYKLRGRVFKNRGLTGDHAEWVVLEIVHHAVNVLLAINDDPTHLFGHSRGDTHTLLDPMLVRLARFQSHASELFPAPGAATTEAGDDPPWTLTTRQFRRTLAWHIAHQPFGIIAGARQYQHAQVAVFEGYAGTSASGFADEVAAEQAIARLDYVEHLYLDWNNGGHSGGGAAAAINAEFARIRAELGDLPGTVADQGRLRVMLDHLTVILHPGALGDCFHRTETAACSDIARQLGKPAGKPMPMLDACGRCPNARRTPVHLPRLQQARNQAQEVVDAAGRRPVPPLQRAALEQHVEQLDKLIAQCRPADPEGTQMP
jgi:hypothetical protein